MKKIAAFTIIEMLITVSILGLMMGGGMAMYGRFNNRQRLQQDTENLVSFLKTVRKKAMVSEMPVSDPCSGSAIDYYGIDLQPSGARYYIRCDSGGEHTQNDIEFTVSSSDITLSQDSSDDITFFAFTGTTNAATKIEITVKHTGLSLDKTIIIENSGLIYEAIP